jgi:hypothetical protein
MVSDLDRKIEALQKAISLREAAEMQSLITQIAIKKAKDGLGTFDDAKAELDKFEKAVAAVESNA